MSDQAEQDHMSTTDQDDLDTTLHNLGTPIAETEEPEEIYDDDIPIAYTESYGTGVHDLPGYIEGGRTMHQRDNELNAASPVLTGGDIDANYEQAYAVGDEAVGGTVATPDQSIVDELADAVGLNMADAEWLHTDEILSLRDDRRWELEPKSSEDYEERRNDEDLD